MGTTGAIKTITSGGSIVLPVTSSHAVLINEIKPDTIPGNTLAAKLEELDKSISDIKTVTDTIQEDGDQSITYINNPEENQVGLRHTNTISNPPTKEAIYKFKIDKNGHITDIKEAGLEDFGIGMPIKYYGEYPTNNTFTPSVGEMYLVNTRFINKYNKGDVNDFAIYDGVKFNIIQSDINPNIQLNNSDSRIYGIGRVTNIYAPTELGDAGQVLATNSAGKGLEWKNIPTTNVKLDTQGNKLTIGDKTISFTGENGISVNSNSTNTITVRSLYSYNEDDFEISGNTISLKNPQEQVTLSAGDGIDISTNTVSVKVDSDSAQYLTVGEDGLKLSGIESAVSKQISESINKLSGSKKGDGTHVKVTVTQTDGKITDVAVSEKNIVSTADLANEIIVRKAADTELDSRIDTLETSVDSMNRAYPHIINEIYGDGTTNDWNLDKDSRIDILTNNTQAVLKEIWGENHNYDWSKSSRIDKLGNAFNWGLRFSKGITLAPHNNGIIVPYGTTEKIYLPKCGVCWVEYTLFSKAPITITVGGISVSLNGEQYVVNKDDENNKFYMRRVAGLKTILSEPYLTIQSSQGTASGIDKTAYLTDIVIYFEDGSPTKQMQLQESINTTTESYRYVNSWDQDGNNSNIFSEIFENLSQGFYQLTYSVQGTSVTPSITTDGEKYCVIASLLYPINTMTEGVFNIRNNGSYFTNRNFYTKDCKVHHDIITTNSNNINSFNYTTFQTIYYVPESGKTTLYLRTWNKGEFTVKNVSLKPISWSDTINNYVINSSTINNSVINNPNLILGSSTSKLFSGTDDSGNVYLKYTINGILKWTLDENGITMSNSDNILAEPIVGTIFYYSLDKPVPGTKLSKLGKSRLNVLDINISTTNGYYIDPINIRLGLDYEVHQCYVVNNGSASIINIYVQNDYIIQDPNLVGY